MPLRGSLPRECRQCRRSRYRRACGLGWRQGRPRWWVQTRLEAYDLVKCSLTRGTEMPMITWAVLPVMSEAPWCPPRRRLRCLRQRKVLRPQRADAWRNWSLLQYLLTPPKSATTLLQQADDLGMISCRCRFGPCLLWQSFFPSDVRAPHRWRYGARGLGF